MGYQNLLMSHGFFTRGAVTIGSHYSDDNLIFSGGLVEAYNLETKVSKYPRIIASTGLMKKVFALGEQYKSSLSYMFEIGEDEIFFFNHFNYNLIDAKASDIFAEDFLKSLGFDGLMESFEENDNERKIAELQEKRAIAEAKLHVEGLESRVEDKYKWFVAFCDYQLGKGNPLAFRNFSEIDYKLIHFKMQKIEGKLYTPFQKKNRKISVDGKDNGWNFNFEEELVWERFDASVNRVRASEGFEVKSFRELINEVALVTINNKNFDMFYRGQTLDYKNNTAEYFKDRISKSTIFPSICRPEKNADGSMKYSLKKAKLPKDISS